MNTRREKKPLILILNRMLTDYKLQGRKGRYNKPYALLCTTAADIIEYATVETSELEMPYFGNF
jgi:hypothetical protein